VSLLNTFITRQSQIHRNGLAAHTNHANPFFQRQLYAVTESFKAMGIGVAEASHRALAQVSAQVDLQANLLSFVNTFWVLGLMVLLLVPRPSSCDAPAQKKQRQVPPCTELRRYHSTTQNHGSASKSRSKFVGKSCLFRRTKGVSR